MTTIRNMVGAAAVCSLVAISACGDEEVASRYVETADITPSGGGTLLVLAANNLELAKTKLEVPAGAVLEAVTVTVEPGAPIVEGDGETAVGPAVDFGPDGLTFSTPALMTLPLNTSLDEGEELRVHVVNADGSREILEEPELTINDSNGTVSFSVSHFTTFQPGRRQRAAGSCRRDSDCAANETCQQGSCVPSNTCSTDADCSAGDWCVRGMCTTPSPGQCRSNADCTGTQTCQSGTCQAPPPQCTSDRDCSAGDWCVRGMCTTPSPGQCRSNADCASNESCIQGICTPNSSGCTLSVSPTALSFALAPGGTAIQSITVANNANITMADFGRSTEFSIVRPTLPGPVSAGSQIAIQYAPSAPGVHQATLTLRETSAICPAVQVGLSGVFR